MRVGFVGAGNMASGIARGWAAARGEPAAPEAMLFSDAAPERARALAGEVGGEALAGNRELAEASDLVLLAVKPNVLDEVAPELADAGTPVVSILAGTTLERLQQALPGVEVVRVMPNLGAQLRQAVLCVVYPDEIDAEHRDRVHGLLALLGDVIELDEGLIDAATALMGCAPGYLALLAEVMVDAGRGEGVPEDEAKRMVARAIAATGGLLEFRDPGELKRAVASPGGMTEAGLEALEQHGFDRAIRAAVGASLERARAL
jgi:pyrroline-5-carboxylate reductase